ncbi:hypothetical protein J5N97_021655 [Dioscorea zingiberensis]|uniref:3-oxo-5-alpha-steroid 4-dehydrogenase C-terminal domain-containing protein n=1 Tax=Dioscorea zingiberensis TaxID=325984 RepID=A0A9D5HA95_9LILI|nr:hypothetical protein J5N97_021655 [Dioscorea zingiberensis]
MSIAARYYTVAPLSLCSSVASDALGYTISQLSEFVLKASLPCISCSCHGHRGTNEFLIPHGQICKYFACQWRIRSYYVASFLFSAAEIHRWYRCKFDNYAVTRRAIVPYV